MTHLFLFEINMLLPKKRWEGGGGRRGGGGGQEFSPFRLKN